MTGLLLKCSYNVSLLLLVVLFLHMTSATVHYVIPGTHYPTTNNSYHTLQYYLNHTITSHTRLQFLQGHHYLYSDFSIQNVTNISLTGPAGMDNAIIDCRGISAGIIVRNVTLFTMAYISLLHCNSSSERYNYRYANVYTRGNDNVMNTAAALHLRFCRSVSLVNLSITVNFGVDGLLTTNTDHTNQMVNVTVQVNCNEYRSFLTNRLVV